MGQVRDRSLKIGLSSLKAADQLFVGNIVASLTDAHGHASTGLLSRGDLYEDQDHLIILIREAAQPPDFLTDRIRENGFKDETLLLRCQCFANRSSRIRRVVWLQVEFARQDIRIHESKSRIGEMRVVKRCLSRAV